MQNEMSTVVMWSKSKPDVQCGGRLREFHGMSSQSVHLPHCRVLPPGEFNGMLPPITLQGAAGEFTVMIPEPHAALQGAVTWRNQS